MLKKRAAKSPQLLMRF